MSAEREALRQQMLLRALLGDARPAVVAGWLREGGGVERGLAAYRAHAAALAERALAAAFPTLQQLLGETSFAALARLFWRRHPPQRGDVGTWGGGLATFIADDEVLAPEPYLADVARLEWAVHEAAGAADAASPAGLERLGDGDPQALWLRLAPGTAVVASMHPIATIWQAHRSDAPDRFAPVREAFATGRGETACVARRGWRVTVELIDDAERHFIAALLAGRPLGRALSEAGAGFDFAAWLVRALQEQRLAAVETMPPQEHKR